MPRQTLLLIIALGTVTAVLLFLALRTQPTPTPTQPSPTSIPTPTPVEQTRLMILPNPAPISPTAKTSTVSVDVDTGENVVTGVQFQLAYDPSMMTNVAIKPGDFFDNPQELLKKVDQKEGRISYAVGVQLLGKGKRGKGSVATITFRGIGRLGDTSAINFIPKSLATAEGIKISVLKSDRGTTLLFSQIATTFP